MNVPMVDLRPQLSAAERDIGRNVAHLFDRMHFILGEQVSSFEREFARQMGATHVIGVGSGTAALELCLRGSGLTQSKREVVTSTLTSPFTAQAILAGGGVPIFADVDPGSLLLDPASAAERITRRTGALLPVHLYGQPCELERMVALARDFGLVLIQDACQAHGARYRGRALTRYSPWVAYSFYPTKNLGCLGDGGAIATGSAAASRRIRLLRDGGRVNDQLSRMAAVNSRLDEMQACYLRAFLPHLADWNARRARLAALYDEVLEGCPSVRPVRRSPDSVNHLYVIRARRRNSLRAFLHQQGIATGIHYPRPLHLHPAFAGAGAGRGSLPHAEKACREILSLPLRPYLKESAVLRVAELTIRFYKRIPRTR